METRIHASVPAVAHPPSPQGASSSAAIDRVGKISRMLRPMMQARPSLGFRPWPGRIVTLFEQLYRRQPMFLQLWKTGSFRLSLTPCWRCPRNQCFPRHQLVRCCWASKNAIELAKICKQFLMRITPIYFAVDHCLPIVNHASVGGEVLGIR